MILPCSCSLGGDRESSWKKWNQTSALAEICAEPWICLRGSVLPSSFRMPVLRTRAVKLSVTPQVPGVWGRMAALIPFWTECLVLWGVLWAADRCHQVPHTSKSWAFHLWRASSL